MGKKNMPSLSDTVFDALPLRRLSALDEQGCPQEVSRELLRRQIIHEIENWQSREVLAKQEIGPYREKVRKSVKIADGLNTALDKAIAKLQELGVEEDIKTATAQRVALGIDPTRVPLRGYSAALDLYLVAWKAMDRLRTWNKLFRPGKHRPRDATGAAVLTHHLETICRRQLKVGLSVNEFDDLLAAINRTEKLPKLARHTLRMRKTRERKSTK